MPPTFVNPDYAIAVVNEIELRISNAKAQIEDISSRPQCLWNDIRIEKRNNLIKIYQSVLELSATKLADTTPLPSTEPETAGE